MVEEARSHAAEDKQRQEEIELRNRADGLIYTTEKTLQENKDKLSEADAKAVTEAVEAARNAVAEGGRERIASALQELTRASHRMAETLYQRTAPSGPGTPGPEPGPKPEGGRGGDDVVDAEVVDKG